MTEMNLCISKKDGIFVSQNKNAFAMLVIQSFAYYLHVVKKRSLLNSCAVVVKRSGGKQNHRFSSFKPDFDTAAIAAPSVAVGFDASRLGISSSIKQPSPAKASSKVRE